MNPTPTPAERRTDRAPKRLPGSDRRAALLAHLAASAAACAGDVLAAQFGVSRQAIVHDIAVLRAEGAPIVPTIRGYVLARSPEQAAHRAVVTVRHRPDQSEDELLAMVEHGVRVTDVSIDHPVYGQLRGNLRLGSPADVRAWSEATRRSGAHFLSELTDGVHRHTIEAASQSAIEAARAELARRGYLVEAQEEPE